MTNEEHTTPLPAGATPAAAPLVPRVLEGRYLLEERIAVGGMAQVWRAHDETLARTVAIKVLHEHLAADDAFRERFRREAIAAAKLGHPNVVAIYDTGEDAGCTYLVMEYVDGVTLKERIAEEGSLELPEVAAVAEQVASALADAHDRGLVHRDVKPANILCGPDGTVKVADFGIAKAAQASRDLTQTGTLLGTATYVAPEQVRSEPLDGRADQFALACVLYEGIAGTPPFLGSTSMETASLRLTEDPLPLRAHRPDVPRSVDDAILTALARDPAERHASVLGLGHALARSLRSAAGVEEPDEAEQPATEAPEAATDGGGTAGDDAGERTATPGRLSGFLRIEGAWLASVLALLGVGVALVAVGVATDVVEVQRIPRILADALEADDADEAPIETPVELTADDLASFDPPDLEDWPGGDDVENDDWLPNLLDGDASTYWRTNLYDTRQFGDLKPGVGFVADLGEPHQLSRVALGTPSQGISYEVRVASEASDDIEDWEVVGEVARAEAVEEFELDEVEATYVLVYVVPDLVDFDGGWSAAFSVLDIRGEPQ